MKRKRRQRQLTQSTPRSADSTAAHCARRPGPKSAQDRSLDPSRGPSDAVFHPRPVFEGPGPRKRPPGGRERRKAEDDGQKESANKNPLLLQGSGGPRAEVPRRPWLSFGPPRASGSGPPGGARESSEAPPPGIPQRPLAGRGGGGPSWEAGGLLRGDRPLLGGLCRGGQGRRPPEGRTTFSGRCHLKLQATR